MNGEFTILIADDNPENIRVLSDMLKQEGYKTRIAVNGEQAVRSVELELPDLVLMDIQMPKMDGYTACRVIKENDRSKDIPILFVSAMSESFNKVRAFDAGGVDYITKPFFSDEVLARVRSHIDLYNYRRNLRDSNIDLLKKFKSTFEQAAVGIVHANPDNGRLLRVNDRLCSMLGLAQEEMLSMSISDFVCPDYREKEQQYLQQLLKGTISHYSYEFPALCHTEDQIWLKITASLVSDETGKPEYLAGVLEDISLRIKAEEDLAREREILIDIFEATLAGYWDWNLAENTEYLSPGFKKMLGYEDHELDNSPDTWQKRMFKEDLEQLLIVKDRHIKSHGLVPFYNEVRFRHRDGSTKWIICAGRVIEWTDRDEAVRMAGCYIDITERKLAEEELAQSEMRFRDIVENIADWVWETDDKGVYTYVSGKVEDVMGYKTEEIIGLSTFDLLPQDEKEHVKELFMEAFRKRAPVDDLESWKLSKSGELLCMQTNAVPIYDENNRFLGYRGVDKDITKMITSEISVRKSEARFRGLMESSADAMIIVNEDHIIIQVNAETERLFGYSRNELVGNDIEMLIPDSSRNRHRKNRKDFMIKPQKRMMGAGKELMAVKNGGGVFPVEISLSPLRTDEGLIISTAIRDITERKMIEAKIKSSEERLSLAIKGGHVGIWDWDVENDVLVWDNSMYRLYGIQESDFEGAYEAWTETLHPDDSQKARRAVELALRGEKNYEAEFRIITSEGIEKYIHSTADTIFNENKKAVRMVGVNIDVTEIRSAESNLRASEKRLKEAQRLAKLGNWELDRKTGVLYWSEEVYRIFGREPDNFKVTYEAFLGSIHPDDRQKVRKAYDEHIKNRKPYDIEHRIVLQDGSVKYVSENCHSEFNKNGEAIKSVGTIQDITDKKLAEEKILELNHELEERVKQRSRQLENEQYFTEKVVNSLPGIFYTFTREGLLKRWNQNYQDLVGLNEKELGKIHVIETIIEEDRDKISNAIKKVINEGYASVEGAVISKKRGSIPYFFTGSLLTINGEEYIVGQGLDITDMKNAQKKLEQINRELKQQKDELEMFNRTMIEREMRNIELKEEVNNLAELLNRDIPYPAVWNRSYNEKED